MHVMVQYYIYDSYMKHTAAYYNIYVSYKSDFRTGNCCCCRCCCCCCCCLLLLLLLLLLLHHCVAEGFKMSASSAEGSTVVSDTNYLVLFSLSVHEPLFQDRLLAPVSKRLATAQ